MSFFSLCSHLKIIWDGGVHFQKVARIWKHTWRRSFYDNLKKFLAKVSFHFHLQLCKIIFEWLVSYVRKKEGVRNQCQNKWNKDFLTKTGFLRSLLITINKLFSKLFTFSILIATFCFEMWNIFEHALRYFIIDNNYKLLITFQQVDVYLNQPIKIQELIKLVNQSN